MDNLTNFIKEYTKNYDPDITKIYVSKNKIDIEEVANTFEITIFKDLTEIRGYLIFIDPCIFANWSHRCEYIFYVSQNEYYEKLEEQWMPHGSLEMEVIDPNEQEIIEDPNERWEKGIDHHPMSKEMYNFISALDFEYGDTFCFKKGGDGDNGEHLMYLMDAYFETQDKNKQEEKQ